MSVTLVTFILALRPYGLTALRLCLSPSRAARRQSNQQAFTQHAYNRTNRHLEEHLHFRSRSARLDFRSRSAHPFQSACTPTNTYILSRTSSISIFCFPSHQQPTFRCTRLQGMKLGSICSLKAFPNSQAKIWPKEISYVFSAATADHRLSMPQCLDITPRNLLTPLPYSPS